MTEMRGWPPNFGHSRESGNPFATAQSHLDSRFRGNDDIALLFEGGNGVINLVMHCCSRRSDVVDLVMHSSSPGSDVVHIVTHSCKAQI